MPRHLVVVGASLAGLRAVEAARRAGFDGRLTLVGAEPYLPYDRPPLSKAFLDADAVPDALYFRDKTTLVSELGVDLRLGAPASGLDLEAREVVVGEDHLGYDALVIATGATARELPGTSGLAGVHTLRTLDDAHAIRRALDEGAQRVVVVGGGFIGSELASSARARGCHVTVLEAAPVPLVRALGETAGALVSSLHAQHGTELRCGAAVSAFLGDESVEHVVLDDGSMLPADLVVVGVGASPATGWLEGSGLALDDGIVCDETLWTGHRGVYAAGDVARWHNGLFDRSMRLEHWTSAAEQGAVAARNAVDPVRQERYETVPYFWSDWYSQRIQFVGVHDSDRLEVIGDPADGRFLALFGKGDLLVGTLGVNAQTAIMKYRGLIQRRTSWADALAFDPAAARARAAS